MAEDYFPCPCCGYLVFTGGPGSDDICPICFWEDDISQLRFPTAAGGANHPSLVEAQENFESFGAIEERLRSKTRAPVSSDGRDPQWRKIDLKTDDVEVALPGIEYGTTYPADSRTLYYWRPQYWRAKLT